MNNIHAAGFIVYKREDEIIYFLLLQYTAGHWDFAKGKVEEQESLHETAVRELFEETGLRPAVTQDFSYTMQYTLPRPDGSTIPKEVTLFLTTVYDDPIKLSSEHRSFGWFPYETALARLTYSNAQHALMSASAALKR
jgi:8-oxo-dGTP pyrophosphatase MutT (NUDIX family)